MALGDLDGIANVQFGVVESETVTWDTASDWDNAADEYGVRHENFADFQDGDGTVAVGFGTYEPHDSGSMLMYCPISEDSGGTAQDRSTGSTTYDGDVRTGTLGQTPGPLGTSYWSGSGGTEITWPSGLDLSANTWTLIWFFRPDVQYDSGNSRIDAWYYLDSGSRPHVSFNKDGQGEWGAWVSMNNGGGNYGVLTSTTSWDADTWYCVGFTYDATQWESWVNGVQENTYAESGTQDSGSGPGIDGYGGEGAAMYMHWNRGLTPTEMEAAMGKAAYLETATKSYNSAASPDLENLTYNLDGASITIEVIGSPGTASEEVVSQALDGATSYSLGWSDTHTDFRVKPVFDVTNDYTNNPTVSAISLTG